MKILMLASKIPYPPKDGGTICTLSMAFSLQKNGHAVSILAINTQKHFFNISDIPKEFSEYIKFMSVEVNTNIKFSKLLKNFFFSKLPYNAERFISKDYSDKLTEILIQEDFDIIQLEGSYLLPYIDVIRKISKAKIAFRAHNVEFEIWERKSKNEKNYFKKLYLHNLYKRIKKFEINYINKYDLISPVTNRDGNKFNELGNTKPQYVAQIGVVLERYIIPDNEPEYPGFFTIGSLDWLPNQEGLIWFIDNVWLKFIKKYPKAKFYIAGRNAPNELLKYFLNNNIEYLGEIKNANDFISSKSIMIVPLFSGSGMRVKIIEGMALGKTIISTSIGKEGIEATHNENILIVDSPEDFFNCLEKVYLDKSISEIISKNAIEFIHQNYDSHLIGEKLSKFYLKQLQS
ncbi:MAG: glycosyltransferase family 4 protein [Bacteroidales bacterium]|jgi:glycosyltransferase involved in cell wall biosynthesis|nr:glycosyltransferase family 4 protein [Bacteroidales bacterium]